MAQDEKGFVIRDRRSRGEEAQQDSPQPPRTEAPHHDPREAMPPISFSSFVFSLGTSALMMLGEKLDPEANIPVNPSQAKEIIDILSMLEAKTQGNLTSEEKAVLENTLYALRMKYVDLASKSPGKS